MPSQRHNVRTIISGKFNIRVPTPLSAANSLVLTASSATIVILTPVNLTVTALDASNNVAVGYYGTVHFSCNGAALLPADSVLVAGKGTFTATLQSAGTEVVTATDTLTSALTASRSVVVLGIQLLYDTFNDAPNTPLSSHTMNVGPGWTVGGNWQINSNNQAVYVSGAGYILADAGTADGVISCDLSKANGLVGIAARFTTASSGSGYFAVVLTNQIRLFENSGAGLILRATAALSPPLPSSNTAYTLQVTCAGLSISATIPGYAGNPVATYNTATVNSGVTFHGMYSQSTTTTFDNFLMAGGTFSVTTSSTSINSGDQVSLTVTAVNVHGATDSGYAGTVVLTPDNSSTSIASGTLTNGVGTFTTALFVSSGNRLIGANDTINLAMRGQSPVITVASTSGDVCGPQIPEGMTTFGFVMPATVQVGVGFAVTVTATNYDGSTATRYTGTTGLAVALTGAPITVVPSSQAYVGGHATFTATLGRAGSHILVVADTCALGFSGYIFVPGTTHLTVAINPSSVTANANISMTVTALDANNIPVIDYACTVAFTSTDPQATLLLPANSTLVNGVGTFALYALRTAGTQTITATDTLTGSITGVSNGVTVAATFTQLFALNPSANSVNAGVALPFTVKAIDPYNNFTSGYLGTVTFSSTDGSANLPADNTLTGGLGTFIATLITGGAQTITAADTASANVRGVSAPITVASSSTLASFAVILPSGVNFNTNLFFSVSTTAAGAGVSATVAVINSAQQFAFNAISPRTGMPANMDLEVSSVLKMVVVFPDDYVGASFAYTDATGTYLGTFVDGAVNLTTTANVGITAGQAASVTVVALDVFSNQLSAYAGTIHFASGDTQAVLPANHTLTAGIGTFSATLKTAGTKSVTVNDITTTSITGTANGVVLPAAIASYILLAAPSSLTAGTTSSLTVTAKDAFNNTATGYLGSAHFTSSDPSAILPADHTLANGVSTFSVSLKTAGTRTITATDTLTASITGVSSGVTVVAGGLSKFIVFPLPVYVTTGNTVSLTVSATDAGVNVITAYAGTVHFTSTDGAATLPANHTLTSGVGTFTATMNTVGTNTVTATDSLTSSISGTSSGIVVGGAFSLALAAASSQYIDAGAGFNCSNLTAATFFKLNSLPSSTGAMRLITLDNTGGTRNFFLVLNADNKAHGLIYTGGGSSFVVVDGVTTLTTGVWYYVAITADGTTFKIYLYGSGTPNGLDGSIAQGGAGDTAPSNTLFIGSKDSGNNFFDGKLSQTLIVNGDLGATVLGQLATKAIDPSTLTLVGLWRLNEGGGTAAIDSTGNHANGVIHGGAAWSTDVP